MTGAMRVLFLCTGNSARSQIAEAFLRALGGPRFEAHSAGSEPKGLNPLTVAAMREAGIDLSDAQSKGLEPYLGEPWHYVITVCDRAAESCPYFPGAALREHWSFPDPAAAEGDEQTRLEAFRSARDAIEARVRGFVESLAVASGAPNPGPDGRDDVEDPADRG